FLDMALGLAFELETQLIVSENLGFANSKDIQPLLEELTQIQKMINKYNQALRTSR
ncbi:MAG TPA: diversity-generating retroelement protein bAvd family protein, partial [Xanthomarina gelatinilytica]|nr:diversity-generating retroelement protein bAvd family protein [Xanthomarina gelatinilytica]